ncbi:MAG: dihydrofolate reductase [Verrucomicrobiota bacterium]
MRPFKAIAAMSENRVIGSGGRIPWHLPDDFKWFKQVTMGQILVMGRKTYESIGRPLPGRQTIVLSRQGFAADGVVTVPDGDSLLRWVQDDPREVFVAGGSEVYQLLLPSCGEVLLTRVRRVVSGDAVFPPFESEFRKVGIVLEHPDFVVERYERIDAATNPPVMPRTPLP